MSHQSDSSEPLSPKSAVMKLEMDVMKAKLDKLMVMMESLSRNQNPLLPLPTSNPYVGSISQTYNPLPPPPPPPYDPPPPPHVPHYEPLPPPSSKYNLPSEDGEEHHSVSHASGREYGDRRRIPNHDVDNDKGLRIDLPEYDGNLNPDKYLEWINAMERIFEYKGYSDAKRFKLAILKFTTMPYFGGVM